MSFSEVGAFALRISAMALVVSVTTSVVVTESHAQEVDRTSEETPSSHNAPRATLSDEIVVTANRLEVPAETVGSSVTVITAEEIARHRKTSVAELLRTVPGVEVARSGGPGQVTSLFIRGGNSSHALVLLDGVRVNSATTGAFDFADLPADAIERIEIVRGPQSTLYGSEAVAGVVAITTRRGSPGVHVAALAEAGGDDHRRFRIGIDGANDHYDYHLAISDFSTDGISAASERAGNSETDPYENTTVTSRLGFAFAGDGRMDLTIHHVRGGAAIDGYDYLVGPVDHLRATQDREALVASLEIKKQLSPRWTQRVTIGVNDDDLVAEDPDDMFNTYAFASRTREASAQSDVTLSKNDVLTLGLSVEERTGGSVGSFDEAVRLHSLFVQNSWSYQGRLFLTAGARHDEHSEFGGETTYRLSSAWLLPQSARLHASYGTAFKAPTLNDLFFPFFSNPELDPETSKGFDLGIEQRFFDDRLTADLTWFSTEFDDLIAYSFATFRPENIARARSEGVELTFAYRPGPDFHLSASHTWNDTEDRGTGLPLARRPEHRFTLSLFFRPHERLTGNATLVAASDRLDSDGTAMDDYERVDLTLHYRMSERFEPYLRIENLFDREYEEINGYTTPGALAIVGLNLGF